MTYEPGKACWATARAHALAAALADQHTQTQTQTWIESTMSTSIPKVSISGQHTEYCIQARTEGFDWYIWRLWHGPHSGGSATIDLVTIQQEVERLRGVDELKRIQFRVMQRTVITTEWTEPSHE